jgi:hypothetical protein
MDWDALDTNYQSTYEPAPVYEHLSATVPLFFLSVAVSPSLFQM